MTGILLIEYSGKATCITPFNLLANIVENVSGKTIKCADFEGFISPYVH
jgi:hypothetical protein